MKYSWKDDKIGWLNYFWPSFHILHSSILCWIRLQHICIYIIDETDKRWWDSIELLLIILIVSNRLVVPSNEYPNAIAQDTTWNYSKSTGLFVKMKPHYLCNVIVFAHPLRDKNFFLYWYKGTWKSWMVGSIFKCRANITEILDVFTFYSTYFKSKCFVHSLCSLIPVMLIHEVEVLPIVGPLLIFW